MLSSKTRSARASAPHFTEERKNSPEKVESHLHNCFYDVAGSSRGLKKERRGARGQLFSFPFDLVGMGMNTTSLMNLQIQIEKTSEGGLVEVGVKIEQFCFGSCPFFEAGCSRNCSGNLCHGCARKGILTACIIEQKYVFSLFWCTTVPRFIQEGFCKFQANPQFPAPSFPQELL